MRPIARFLRVAAIAAVCVVTLAVGVYFMLLSRGVFDTRTVVYGFKIAARVTVGETTYSGEAITRCTAHQDFPHVTIAFGQQGQTLAMRIDQGRVFFVGFQPFNRSCHPADPLWNSAAMARWDDFIAALADARRSQRRIPIDPATTGIFIADDALHPRRITQLDAASSLVAGQAVRIDDLYLQVVADPAPQANPTSEAFAATFPWARSTEHESADPLQC
jgi:hypothetical protein